MSITKEETKKIARLARIGISDEEIDELTPQLNNILGFIETLSNLDTKDVEPLANVAEIDLKRREDVVNDGAIQEQVLANAPESLEGFYVVPKVVE